MKTGQEYSSEQLKEALYAVEDMFDRLHSCPFYPLKDTAKSISVNPDNPLEGNKIYVGVKELEWTRQRKSTFEVVAKYLKLEVTETPKGYEFEIKGVPVEIHLIKRKYKFFEKPNITFWGVAEFLMPNPIDGYLKSQYLIK